MLQGLKSMRYKLAGVMTMGMLMVSSDAFAQSGNNWSSISKNITTSIQDLPGLLSALAYMFGILLAVLGILKIKDHVENPSQTPLKDGAIRLAVGGALFAIPILSEAMFNTVGTGQAVSSSVLKKVQFTTQ